MEEWKEKTVIPVLPYKNPVSAVEIVNVEETNEIIIETGIDYSHYIIHHRFYLQYWENLSCEKYVVFQYLLNIVQMSWQILALKDINASTFYQFIV